LASKIVDNKIFNNENVVKVITEVILEDNNFPKALTFKRKISEIKNNIYHHLGIYCYSVEALERFVNLQQSESEIKNRLEQLRALDNQQTINVALANSSPIGVDTEEDYIAIKKIMEYK
jgi:3-deoxy-manno-octulosonate cytidylyltransferase (CMP-KDO synthetase)